MSVDTNPATDTQGWERLAPIGGAVFVTLDLIVAMLGSEPPAPDAPRAQLSRYYLDHAAGIEAGLWLFGIGAIALILWFAGLWRWMVRTEHGQAGLAVASLLGLAIAGSLALASSAVWASLALRGGAVGDDLEAVHALGAVLSSAAGIGIAAHLLATTYIGVGQRALPRWVTVIGLASAAGWIFNTVAGSTSSDASYGSVGFVAFALWCTWILGVSHRMWTGRTARLVSHEPASSPAPSRYPR